MMEMSEEQEILDKAIKVQVRWFWFALVFMMLHVVMGSVIVAALHVIWCLFSQALIGRFIDAELELKNE